MQQKKKQEDLDWKDKEERCLHCKLLGFRGLLGFVLILLIGGLLLFAYRQFASPPFYVLLLIIVTFTHPILFLYLLYKAGRDASNNEIFKKDEKTEEKVEKISWIQIQWRCLKESYDELRKNNTFWKGKFFL